MKQIVTLLAMMLVLPVMAQEEKEKTRTRDIRPDPLVRVYGFSPLPIGNNTLNEAHKENFGAGINASFVSIYNFHVGIGYHNTQYDVTDAALAGNFKHSRYWGFYPFVSYEIPVAEKFILWPEVGAGYAKIKQTHSGQRFSDQEGTEFRFGLVADYRLTRHFSFFASTNYIFSKMRIDANPAVKDFYGSLSQLQFCVGVQVEVWPSRPKEDVKANPEKSQPNP